MGRSPRSFRLSLLLACAAALGGSPALAAWPHDPNVNVPLCQATGDQDLTRAVSDGAGGAIICWTDSRGSGTHIFAQRVSAAGVPLWTTDGVQLSTFAGAEVNPAILADGAGGAIVVYQEVHGSFYDIYAQRVNASGALQWTATGLPVCQAAQNQQTPRLCADGAGGAIITWADFRGGAALDIFAQRLNGAGSPQWATDGVAVCQVANTQDSPVICADGAGGAIITWHDQRITGNDDIYAQRLNGSGALQWFATGVQVNGSPNTQAAPQIVPDNAGGAIVTWQDLRNGTDTDIYAQRLSASGALDWVTTGVGVAVLAAPQVSPVLAPDGAGGAIIAWSDQRGAVANTFAQHLSSAGAPLWAANGIALGVGSGNQNQPAIAADGSGGAFVAWTDGRPGGASTDAFAQHVTSGGALLGAASGIAISAAVGSQSNPSVVDDSGTGAILAWEDLRAVSSYDIYSQRLDAFGYLGNPEPVLASVNDVPNDQGGRVKLAWYPSYLDGNADPNLAAYDIYTSAPGSAAFAAAKAGARLLTSFAERPAPGERAYVVDPARAQLYAWQYVATVTPAHFLGAYGYVTTTTGDSTGLGNPPSIYMVVGRNASGSMYWLSAPDSGYSVDNLPPVVPAPFTGAYSAGATHLHWGPNSEPDLAGYRLYRGASAGFTPGTGNLVAAQADTGFVDAGPAGSFYKLSAVDVHGNESPFALLGPNGTTSVGGPAPRALALALASANPGRGGATLRYALPQAGSVRLAVFDMLGREVRVLWSGALDAGEGTMRWDGRDAAGRDAGGGLYLVRFTAQGREVATRFVLLR